MMDDTHIADCIAVKLLLAGVVLTGASVGALGLADVASHANAADVGDDAAAGANAALLFPIDNVTTVFGHALAADAPTRLLFPVDNVTATGVTRVSRLAFPIDNATFDAAVLLGSWDVTDTDRVRSEAVTRPRVPGTDRYALGQDMDPYALGQDMDPYLLALRLRPDAPGQDMDPY
jgi:hypothetical protein